MNPLNEVREVKKAPKSEVAKSTKAFESNRNDVQEPRHIKTDNEKLDGKRHPVTDVPYKKREFRLNGEKVEGVFPVFESKCDVRLPKDLRKASDSLQFKYCVKDLGKRVERSASYADTFTKRQLEQIKNWEPRISGLTWHHNEIPGKMQLVDAEKHSRSSHTGGKSLWGGGR